MPQVESNSIARVIVDISLDREFEYRIPKLLAAKTVPGSRVVVPFGGTRRNGYVVGVSDHASYSRLKDIYDVVGDEPLIDKSVLSLAYWISDYYCAPLEQSVRSVLPAAVRRQGAGFKERLFVTPDHDVATDEFLDALRRKAPKQAAAMRVLVTHGSMFLQEVCRKAHVTAATVNALRDKGAVSIGPQAQFRDPEDGREVLPTDPFDLMPEQAEALSVIRTAGEMLDPHVVLLYGVTGSGKTEVYLQAIQQVLAEGRGAIVLVPEVSLTPQTVERFRSRFGDRIAVLHSYLSEGERHDEWHRLRQGDAMIAIGARSAVFAPVRQLGLIVVDEEHEATYKQEEAPRYHARDVAVMRGSLTGCAVVLGSATPSLESYRNAKSGKYRLSVLSKRVDNRRMPHVSVIDMRLEAQRNDGKASVFSQVLIEKIRDRLEKAEQTMLFLNRRGYASSLVCPRCGYVAACPHCSVSPTCHISDDTLRCHMCGAIEDLPAACPECDEPAYKMTGIGTQRVERIVNRLFPRARVQRMDTDVTSGKGSHARILGDFRTGKIDILVGTQMIAKGLDFPNVTLIGVIFADLSLHMPDFRAGERTFQLLTQVAGRAGRGDVPGLVIVQTYTPFHPAVQAAQRMDFETFYDQEVEFRKELNYPPFARLICLTVRARSESKASFYSDLLARELSAKLTAPAMLTGPAVAPIAKAKGYFRSQIMLRSTSVKAMVAVVRDVTGTLNWPPEIKLGIDVDAVSLL